MLSIIIPMEEHFMDLDYYLLELQIKKSSITSLLSQQILPITKTKLLCMEHAWDSDSQLLLQEIK